MRTAAAVSIALATVALVAASPEARAQVANTPPPPPGAEQYTPARQPPMHQGLEGDVGIGTGFSDTYGLGLEGRVGYTFSPGVYAGGAISYFHGQSIAGQTAHATFLGGEIGYKFFPDPRFEVRPYVFVGPSFITQVAGNPVVTSSSTDLALQPSALFTYHVGQAFVGADVRWLVTPSPATLAVLASGGVGF